MSWLEFISAMTGHVLSWPVFALLFVVLYKEPVKGLLKRLRSWKGGPAGDFDFAETLEKAEKSADALPSGQEVATPVRPSEPTNVGRPAADEFEQLARQASENPSYAVLRAWEEVMHVLLNVAEANGLAQVTSRPLRTLSPNALVRELEVHRLLSKEVRPILENLREMRNSVAHGQANPTVGEAAAYASLAGDVARGLLDRQN